MADRESCLRRCMLGMLASMAVLLALSMSVLYFAAGWLHVEHKPSPAEAALVLAGGYYRALYAADLFRQGYVDHVYISKAMPDDEELLLERIGIPFLRQEEIYRRILKSRGVPGKAISILGDGAVSTLEEALTVKRKLGGKLKSLLVVTSPFHVRRAQLIFSDVLPGMRVNVVSTPYEKFPDKWWTEQASARNVALELLKIPFYLLGGGFVSSEESRGDVR